MLPCWQSLWPLAVKKKKLLLLLQHLLLLQPLLLLTLPSQLKLQLLLQPLLLLKLQRLKRRSNSSRDLLSYEKANLRVGFFYACNGIKPSDRRPAQTDVLIGQEEITIKAAQSLRPGVLDNIRGVGSLAQVSRYQGA